MKDSEVIAAAQDLIRDPDAWVKGDWCIGNPSSKEGVKMCTEGAIERVLGLWEWTEKTEPVCFPDNITGGMEWRTETWTNWVRTGGPEHTRADRLETELARLAKQMYPDLDIWEGLGEDELDTTIFNDSVSVSHDMVMAVMDKYRAQLEEQGK